MTYEDKKQWASDVLGDISLALERKKRMYKRYMKHGAVSAAADLAAEIERLETELQCERKLFGLTFN